MTEQQKRYIETNIELIEDDRWDEFFNTNRSRGIGEVLYEAGIHFLNEMTYVPNYAFYYCNNLTSISIPNSITSIGHRAFSDCTRLMDVTMTNGVISIGSYAFTYCISLPTITIPDKGVCLWPSRPPCSACWPSPLSATSPC